MYNVEKIHITKKALLHDGQCFLFVLSSDSEGAVQIFDDGSELV